MTAGWPIVLQSNGVRLRPLSKKDRRAWYDLRRRNADWLRPWDATPPPGAPHVAGTFLAMLRAFRAAEKAGTNLAFAIEVDRQLAGQLTINNIARGSAQFASIGYWIDEAFANRGITTRAVAMAIDYSFGPLGLHRIEIAVRPENVASLRVVEKLGLTRIGLAPKFLHIDGDWRDHILFAVTADEAVGGLLKRLDSLSSQE